METAIIRPLPSGRSCNGLTWGAPTSKVSKPQPPPKMRSHDGGGGGGSGASTMTPCRDPPLVQMWLISGTGAGNGADGVCPRHWWHALRGKLLIPVKCILWNVEALSANHIIRHRRCPHHPAIQADDVAVVDAGVLSLTNDRTVVWHMCAHHERRRPRRWWWCLCCWCDGFNR